MYAKRINDFVEEYGDEGLQNWIEKDFLPEMDTILDKAYDNYKNTGENLNDFFKGVNDGTKNL